MHWTLQLKLRVYVIVLHLELLVKLFAVMLQALLNFDRTMEEDLELVLDPKLARLR